MPPKNARRGTNVRSVDNASAVPPMDGGTPVLTEEVVEEAISPQPVGDDAIEGVPPKPPQIPIVPPPEDRAFLPLSISSSEGQYLEENVWPVLQPALEKLLNAIRVHIPKKIRAQYEDPTMRRTLYPHHAVGLEPLTWLGTFLKRHNPNKPPAISLDEAATLIQAGYRGHKARSMVRRIRTAQEEERTRREEKERREHAAKVIQSVYRGHSVRLAISLGRLDALRAKVNFRPA